MPHGMYSMDHILLQVSSSDSCMLSETGVCQANEMAAWQSVIDVVYVT